MSKITRGNPAIFVVLGDIFWHQSPCNLSLRAGTYIAVPALQDATDGIGEPVRWEITKETGLLTMSALQAQGFQRDGKLRIEP